MRSACRGRTPWCSPPPGRRPTPPQAPDHVDVYSRRRSGASARRVHAPWRFVAGAPPVLCPTGLHLPALILLDHWEGGRDEHLTWRWRLQSTGCVKEGRGPDVPAVRWPHRADHPPQLRLLHHLKDPMRISLGFTRAEEFIRILWSKFARQNLLACE